MDELKSMISGRVLVEGDDGFDEARTPWHLGVDQRVRAVVEVAGAADVVAAVRYAREHGLTVTAQAGGHGASGTADGAILLRTGALGGVEIDGRVARVGAGVRWGELLAAAEPLGLAGLAGSSPVVSVVGYTLGGGVSWFGRKYGPASDHVRAFDVVTAEGEQVRVDAASDPDLFWALRGGGGDFAVVTAMEFDLFPLPALYGGRITWPFEQARRVLETYREVTAEAPDELAVWFTALRIPGGPSFVTVDTTYLGEDPGDLLAPFDKIGGAIGDTRAVLPVSELGTIADEPTEPSAGVTRFSTLSDLSGPVIDVLLNALDAPVVGAALRHLGGALARQATGGGAAAPLAEPYYLQFVGMPAPDTDERIDALLASLADHRGRLKPFNGLSEGERVSEAFPEAVLDRLRRIKRERDPRGVITANHPVS
ncbi:FAD-binding oxidoreductase [Nonomuraea antri]|uniref:FAD-binding oxidoreductase n=1 Tax=Nonomuraea antri TaxID=2730852 RepID=UPI002E284AA8|nr:FAD-binding oxidoreductase [Nonomuraea antri]